MTDSQKPELPEAVVRLAALAAASTILDIFERVMSGRLPPDEDAEMHAAADALREALNSERITRMLEDDK